MDISYDFSTIGAIMNLLIRILYKNIQLTKQHNYNLHFISY